MIFSTTKASLVAGSFLLLLASCQSNVKDSDTATTDNTETVNKDLHTQSNAHKMRMEHLSLDVSVSFEKKEISGSATWRIANDGKEEVLILDTYNLSIDSVLVSGKKQEFKLGTAHDILGSPLTIPITPTTKEVQIFYKSGQNATALQWLTPAQTYDGSKPFLYTQSESIYARSWIPCPDGPGIRFTYDARVQVPKDLMAVMSATNPQQKNDSGIYRFNMDIPIPAYLLALAVGDITFQSLGARTGVYAEPGLLAAAAEEFSGLENMLKQAEALYGSYRWSRYDCIVLPPGFPIGGMENPKLTFLTPTIIAGDKSLVNLIAHEMAHSWSGNLVTNETWNDFWLNEGFTVYFERRLTEKLNDKSYVDMQWELGYQDLVHTVQDLGDTSRDTHLKLDLTGRDPDEGLTDIAYEKGAHFLKLLEQTVGREKMDVFLTNYFNSHEFKTINTEKFLQYLDENLLKGDSNLYRKLNIQAWVYGPGILANCPHSTPDRFKQVDATVAALGSGKWDVGKIQTEKWSTYEWLRFLRNLPKPISQENMAALDASFKLTQTGNAEIANLWLVHAIHAGYKPAYPTLENFLRKVGRRKFLEPLYEALIASGKKAQAQQYFQQYKNNYHPLAQTTMEKMIKTP